MLEVSHGIIVHSALLFALLFHSAFSRSEYYASLSIAPLIRILSLSIPLYFFSQKYWLLIVSFPVFLAVFACMYVQRLGLDEVGLKFSKHPMELGVIIAAIPLGVVEYAILKPDPLTTNGFFFLALILLISGFFEELYFRGLLQYNALNSLGSAGIPFVALLFGSLHIGNSALDALFATAVGFFYSLVVKKTGSIFGVTISHWLINLMLFLIMPLDFLNYSHAMFLITTCKISK